MTNIKKIKNSKSSNAIHSLEHEIFLTLAYPIMLITEDGIIESLNDAAAQLFDYTLEELQGQPLNILVPKDMHFHHTKEVLSKKHKVKKTIGFLRQILGVKKHGEKIPLRIELQRINYQKNVKFIGVLFDLEKWSRSDIFSDPSDFTLAKLNEALDHSQANYKTLFEESHDATWLIVNGQFTMCNQASVDVLGYNNKQELENTHPSKLSPEFQEDGMPSFEKAELMMSIALNKGYHRFEWLHKKKDGTVFPVEVTLTRIIYNKEPNLFCVWRDISERKQVEEDIQNRTYALERAQKELHHQATHDILTALPNRRMFDNRLEHAIHRATRHNEKLAVCFLDLDRFKIINDTLGHRVGDQLLIEVAHRLEKCVRKTDTIARHGGDEFCILLENISDDHDYETVCKNIIDIISRPFLIKEKSLYVGVSIGISIFPKHGTTADALTKRADTAMYAVKDSGKNNYLCFTNTMMSDQNRRNMLEQDLRHAIEQNQFYLVYQPKIDIKNNSISGCEALLRWEHPIHGLVPTLEFINIAEENGYIQEIGQWVLQQAVKQIEIWDAKKINYRNIAVNISAAQLMTPKSLADFLKTLGRTPIAADSLQFELTETMIMNNYSAETKQFIDVLDACGHELNIDDFGTGYSSLSYLKSLKIGTLKIDRSFIKNLENQAEDQAIVEAIIALSKKLNIRTIAEGVENKAQLSFLKKAGCDEVQGYYFAKPLSVDQFEDFVLKF